MGCHIHQHWSAVPTETRQRHLRRRRPTSLPPHAPSLFSPALHQGTLATSTGDQHHQLGSASGAHLLGIGSFLTTPSHRQCRSVDVRAAPGLAVPSQWCADTRVVSTTSCPQTEANPRRLFPAASRHECWVPRDPNLERTHSLKPAPCLVADPCSHTLQHGGTKSPTWTA